MGQTTKDQLPAVLAFLLIFLTGIVGIAIVQYYFNNIGAAEPVASTPGQPVPDTTPTAAPVASSEAVSTPEIPAGAPAETPTTSETPAASESQPPTPPNPTVMG